ncbi:177L [Cherax quadricarinatus iridovirus]|uniref:Rgv late protein n=1 Tax=Shrimp hemocyte iridescent virus TaxID=2039780 RepID=A0A291B0Y4_9VIRU|nr:177L [Cherax quadricarinatus iridovirus]YP_010084902.1 rgv late protein [Shrimp hemocyte iridescent virus]UPA43321.1 rgv late protein [Iridovirus CN01]ASZ85157.1 177L [Cherax quadricarinatus iridovirus]ATE87159.1 rgv late protein [Shrimp hemocyte iridescent virus]UPA43556.1 rgv late protein [Iridovirus CN01]UPA43753.1 rgv late protein [Iridovirus CN01]
MNVLNTFEQTPGSKKIKPLSDEETEIATQSLCKDLFPKVNRKIVDPYKAGEPKFALFSFIDAPDEQLNAFLKRIECELCPDSLEELQKIRERPGVIRGVAKIRGAYMTQNEANDRAEEIIQDIDSMHSIFTCLIGHPFPLISQGMAEEINEVELKNQVEKTVKQNEKEQKRKEQRQIDEIMRRQEELEAESEKPHEYDIEDYLTDKIKLGNLRAMLDKNSSNKTEFSIKEERSRNFLITKQRERPDFEENYFDLFQKVATPNMKSETLMNYLQKPLNDVDEEDCLIVEYVAAVIVFLELYRKSTA